MLWGTRVAELASTSPYPSLPTRLPATLSCYSCCVVTPLPPVCGDVQETALPQLAVPSASRSLQQQPAPRCHLQPEPICPEPLASCKGCWVKTRTVAFLSTLTLTLSRLSQPCAKACSAAASQLIQSPCSPLAGELPPPQLLSPELPLRWQPPLPSPLLSPQLLTLLIAHSSPGSRCAATVSAGTEKGEEGEWGRDQDNQWDLSWHILAQDGGSFLICSKGNEAEEVALPSSWHQHASYG